MKVRERGTGWPWTIPALAALDELPLAPGVTFLVGENGSGKSTLIEGIAVAAGFAPEGGSLNFGAKTRREKAVLNLALSDANRRSQYSGITMPSPAAAPFTAAITGLLSARK